MADRSIGRIVPWIVLVLVLALLALLLFIPLAARAATVSRPGSRGALGLVQGHPPSGMPERREAEFENPGRGK